MSGSGSFVQLPHPGGEHRPDRDGHKAWTDYDSLHARKFMQVRGRSIDGQGMERSGNLWAWGEWEAPSELLQRLDRPDSIHQPEYLWSPYYIGRPGGHARLHNTDPFIFGDRMLYSNCVQKHRKNLKRLERGSLIVFGSMKKHGWVLDTVLVVTDHADYLAEDARTALAGLVPDSFLEVTGGPLADNDTAEAFRLYRGATPDDPVDSMFSFIPAAPAGGSAGFKRPVIDLPEAFFTKGLRQNCKISGCLASETLSELWRSIADQVLNAGLLLGTHAVPPNKRRA